MEDGQDGYLVLLSPDERETYERMSRFVQMVDADSGMTQEQAEARADMFRQMLEDDDTVRAAAREQGWLRLVTLTAMRPDVSLANRVMSRARMPDELTGMEVYDARLMPSACLKVLLTGWEGMRDENGKPLPFSQYALGLTHQPEIAVLARAGELLRNLIEHSATEAEQRLRFRLFGGNRAEAGRPGAGNRTRRSRH